MDREEKIKISYLGVGMVIGGFLSIILSFMPFNLIILIWMDFFGETIGWIIKISFIVFGLIIYYTYDQPDEEDADSELDI